MPSLVVKVKAKMALHAHEKVRGMLEGQYGSIFKGRSMDFDDLREYIIGDDIKDIDWRATARSGSVRIRRYVAIRKHNILLVVDTGRNMAATSEYGDNKRDVAVMATGVLGHIALKNGDLVGMVAADGNRPRYFPIKGTYQHLESILQFVQDQTRLDKDRPDTNLEQNLEFISRNLRKKMLLVIVSDRHVLSVREQTLLRRLRAQHEIAWVNILDAQGVESAESWQDIDDAVLLTEAIQQDQQVIRELAASIAEDNAIHGQTLDRIGIAHAGIGGDRDVVSGLFRLLEVQKHARRH